jgi:hypothetical protein
VQDSCSGDTVIDVVGKAFSVPPEQIAATGVNVGVTFGLTVIVIVAVSNT